MRPKIYSGARKFLTLAVLYTIMNIIKFLVPSKYGCHLKHTGTRSKRSGKNQKHLVTVLLLIYGFLIFWSIRIYWKWKIDQWSINVFDNCERFKVENRSMIIIDWPQKQVVNVQSGEIFIKLKICFLLIFSKSAFNEQKKY